MWRMSMPSYSSPGPQSSGAVCALHSERSAATICNRCGNYACEQCFEVGADRQDYCVNCLPRTESAELATRMSRLNAVLIDQFFLVLPAVLLGGLGYMLTKEWWGVLAFGGAAFVFSICYMLYLLSEYGQTVGKRAMNIKVVRTDGSAVSLGRLFLLRNFVPGIVNMPTSGLFNLIDTLVIFGEPRRCLHDYIADTKVIVVARSS
jgi:uncharacterized RDD family membrane protein YckC